MQAVAMNSHPLKLADARPDTRIRTLVVHESRFMLKILVQTLQQAGDFNFVGTVTDAYQALRHVAVLSPELVLMGVHMPGITGIHATRYIKHGEHSPVVILISSHNNVGTKSLAEQAGADGFVSTQGNFRYRLIRVLKDLMGSSAGRLAADNGVRFVDPRGR